MAAPPPRTVLIKPAGPACNLACSYCFYLKKSELYPGRTRMDLSTAEVLIRQALDLPGEEEVVFVWQGGEPTLMGLDFFEEIVALQRKHGGARRVSNAIQTNGLRVDQAWARFLSRHDFLVGLSLDGPRHIHDRHRRGRGGQPSFDRVMEALSRLRAHSVRVNALATVHRDSQEHGAEVYAFLRGQGFDWVQFIPVVERDDTGQPAPWSVSAVGYGRYVVEVFDLWIRSDVGRVHVRLFEELLRAFLGGSPALCVHAPGCGHVPLVEHTGDVYACDHLVDAEHFRGNLLQRPLWDIISDAPQRDFGLSKQRDLAPACRACRWLWLCGGGCIAHRWVPGEPSFLCPSYLHLYPHLAPALRALAQRVERGQDPAEVMDLVRRGAPLVGRNQPCPCGSGLRYKRCCQPPKV